jgi:type III pantothenate kinase
VLLAVDIGNTNIKFGLFEDTGTAAGTLVHTWRSVTNRRQTSDELAALVDGMLRVRNVAPASIARVAAANVVPHLYRAVTGMSHRYFNCRTEFISAARQTLMPVRTQRPAELGADLIANAIAAVKKYGAPAIIVGFGTATTFSGVDKDGAFVGTAIAPGIEISVDALSRRAAQLLKVELTRPNHVIGKNTVEALQSGIIFGFAGQIEGIARRMAAELAPGDPDSVTIIATGGLAPLVIDEVGLIDAYEPWLTLIGLRLVFERNTADS